MGTCSEPEIEVVETAAPLRAEHAQSVGVVHQQPGARCAAVGGQLRQRRQVPVHAEDAVGGDESAPLAVQHARERRCVRMRITPQARPAQQGAVEQGGVVQSVLEHLIAAPARAEITPRFAM